LPISIYFLIFAGNFMAMEQNVCTIDQPERLQRMAYVIEEMILVGLQKFGDPIKPDEYMTALGLATGHCVQSANQTLNNLINFRPYYEQAFKQSYNHFKKHPQEAFPEVQIGIYDHIEEVCEDEE
jgi:hypothetical protein